MAAKAGELARETGDYRCTACLQRMHVSEGVPIAICPNCGNESYETGFVHHQSVEDRIAEPVTP